MTDGRRWQVKRVCRGIIEDMRTRGVKVGVRLDPDPRSRGLDIEVETPPEMGIEDARAVVAEVYRRVGDAFRSVGAGGIRLTAPVEAG